MPVDGARHLIGSVGGAGHRADGQAAARACRCHHACWSSTGCPACFRSLRGQSPPAAPRLGCVEQTPAAGPCRRWRSPSCSVARCAAGHPANRPHWYSRSRLVSQIVPRLSLADVQVRPSQLHRRCACIPARAVTSLLAAGTVPDQPQPARSYAHSPASGHLGQALRQPGPPA